MRRVDRYLVATNSGKSEVLPFKPEAASILEKALIRGELERGPVTRITGLPDGKCEASANLSLAFRSFDLWRRRLESPPGAGIKYGKIRDYASGEPGKKLRHEKGPRH